MTDQNDRIQEGSSLNPGGFITSPSRLFFAILEANGDLDVYAGEGPDDPQKRKVWTNDGSYKVPSKVREMGFLLRRGFSGDMTVGLRLMAAPEGHGLIEYWSAGFARETDPDNPMFLTLADDGNLSLKQGDREYWNSGFRDPVTEFIIESYKYDVPKAKIKSDSESGVLSGELENDVDLVQTLHVTDSRNTTATSS